jgi:hypothetical protein
MAYVLWTQSPDAPKATNPHGDVVFLRFDACDSFPQQEITSVLSTAPASNEECLRLEETVREGVADYYIYSVVPPAEADQTTRD